MTYDSAAERTLRKLRYENAYRALESPVPEYQREGAANRNAIDAALEEIARRTGQIDALASVLFGEFGGPIQDESACEMAIRVLREQQGEIARLRETERKLLLQSSEWEGNAREHQELAAGYKAALERYGQHEDGCQLEVDRRMKWNQQKCATVCDCGLAAALAEEPK